MKYFYLLFSLLILSSCNGDDGELSLQIGEDYINSNTKVFFIETMTVESSTIKFDSLIVSNSNRILVGAYNDPIFGTTQSKSFLQLQNSYFDINDEAVYDSIALILNYDKYFYNDTIPIQQFEVYEVLETIKPDEGYYFNSTNFNVSNLPIAIKDFIAKPKKDDSLHISVIDTYGSTLFNKIMNNDINNIVDYHDEYKGLQIVANEAVTTSVLGFSKESFLRMYYSIPGEIESDELFLDFDVNYGNTFNQITSDKTGTYFESIEDQETVLSSLETDNSSFIQSGTGIVTRINIPHIKSLNDIQGDGVVVDAKLKFSIKQDSDSQNLFTRDSLSLFVIDRKGNVLENLLALGSPVFGNIVNDDPEFETDLYEVDIKPFIELKQAETFEEYFLAIYSQEFNESVDRYIFNGGQSSEDLKMKLELTYAIYDED